MFRSRGGAPRCWLALAVLIVLQCCGKAQEPSAEQKAFIEQMRSLNWVKGPTTIEVQGNSKLTIPQALCLPGSGQHPEIPGAPAQPE